MLIKRNPETMAGILNTTAAMISCCAHYLVTILPILGVTGILTVVAAYQVQFFWVGLAFNLFGIYYVVSRIRRYTREAT